MGYRKQRKGKQGWKKINYEQTVTAYKKFTKGKNKMGYKKQRKGNFLKKGDKVKVRTDIDPELDPARYRGTKGTIVRESKKYKNQYWIKMDRTGDTIIRHKKDLIKVK